MLRDCGFLCETLGSGFSATVQRTRLDLGSPVPLSALLTESDSS